ncbi:1-hydroxycarotenoid 3,4-desaturase CrtD [Tateyamaria omphalii]|uniref:Methoxyneurosporene dehydrogenase n=1 Tax=Tateyamaria omphalii TaxID=299262 RepID=A0A1P8N1X2_9RHOB|nr:1-hydroxycarotenoid 3,4-desaturase CrtD [Tateyamaria omphalii]APX14189.1 methoxyneurosporene dehydrogenase [Tateyamaria omphalii]
MTHVTRPTPQRAVIIGAGIAGLACAARLRATGYAVTLLERHGVVGGKIRTIPSPAGPIDAGPTVLTMRHVFDDLFAQLGTRVEDHVTLIKQDELARHFWPDGSTLSLYADETRTIDALRSFGGDTAVTDFLKFTRRTRQLFAAFDAPMMQAPEPKLAALTKHVLRQPHLIPAMAPLSTLKTLLKRSFRDPRLRQLFGRYATYVGGSPTHAPAILSLIWQAEANGVWVVEGGMHKLTQALGKLLDAHGVETHTNAHVDHIDVQDGTVRAVHLENGTHIPCDVLIHAGDPRALATGALGPDTRHIAPQTAKAKRSFSARVLSFAATPQGPDLAHHNVFFAADAHSEFNDLMAGRIPAQPSFYICALDRGHGTPPPPLERFEIITNAPATGDTNAPAPADTATEDLSPWLHQITRQMAQHGIRFAPTPDTTTITTPQAFGQMFPASLGALYGQTPHGLTAALQRPTARTQIPNLYLAGGGTHPGAGVPMATLSARHAAEAILSDQTSTSRSGQTATHGGMSTA